MPRLVELTATEEFEIRKEATYAICNACLGGSPAVVNLLLELRVLPPLLDLLECPDANLILTARHTPRPRTRTVESPHRPALIDVRPQARIRRPTSNARTTHICRRFSSPSRRS